MGLEAGTKALLDAGVFTETACTSMLLVILSDVAGLTYDAIETAFVGFCYGDSTSGQVGFALQCCHNNGQRRDRGHYIISE